MADLQCDDCAHKVVGPVVLQIGSMRWAFHRRCLGYWRGGEVKKLGVPRNNPEDIMKEVDPPK